MSDLASYTRARARLAARKAKRAELNAEHKNLHARLTAAREKFAAARRAVARHKPKPLSAPQRAVNLGLSHTGTVEQPAGSNRGPKITAWQLEMTPGMSGYPWCGAFVGHLLRAVGVQNISGRRIIYTPAILADAATGANGFEKLVPIEQTQPGDLVLMDFAPGGPSVMHVGMATSTYDRIHQTVATVEGNTSFSEGGSQSNGGAVAKRVRGRGVIVGIARPRWPR